MKPERYVRLFSFPLMYKFLGDGAKEEDSSMPLAITGVHQWRAVGFSIRAFVLDLFRYLWYHIVPLLLRMTKAHSISQYLSPCSCAHIFLCYIHRKCKLVTRCLPPLPPLHWDWIVIRTTSSNSVFSTPQHDVTTAPTILFPGSFFLKNPRVVRSST